MRKTLGQVSPERDTGAKWASEADLASAAFDVFAVLLDALHLGLFLGDESLDSVLLLCCRVADEVAPGGVEDDGFQLVEAFC